MIAPLNTFVIWRRQRAGLARRLQPLLGAMPASVASPADEAMPLPGWAMPRLVRAGIEPRRQTLLLVAGGIVLIVLAALAAGRPLLALGCLVLPPAMFAVAVEWRGIRNLQAFVAGLPFLLDSILQLLRVGNSLQQALLKSVETSGPALRRFLDPAVHRIAHGAPVADALQWAGDRIALPELRMLAASVKINSRHGGSMAAILANFAQLLRQAAQVKRDLQAASAEVRFSGHVLMAMPLVIAAMMTSINPGYLRFFTTSAEGPRLAIIAIGLQLAGMAMMRWLMRLPF